MKTLKEAIDRRIIEKREAAAVFAAKANEEQKKKSERCAVADKWLRAYIEKEYGFDAATLEITIEEQSTNYAATIIRPNGHISLFTIVKTGGNFQARESGPAMWHAVKRERRLQLYCDYDNLLDAIMYVDEIEWRE